MKNKAILCAAALLSTFSTSLGAKDCAYDNFAPPKALKGRSYCLDDALMSGYVRDFGMDPHWDGEWSGSPGDVDSPKCVVLEAISVLRFASIFAPDESQVLKEAYDFSSDEIEKLKPSCTGKAPAVSGAGSIQDDIFAATGIPFAYALADATKLRRAYLEAPVPYRAAILRHEAAHRGGRTHLLSGKDKKYENYYEVDKPSVHSQTVDWLIEYIALDETRPEIMASPRPVIDRANRVQAVKDVNFMLENHFSEDPGFRINVPDIAALAMASANGTTLIDQRKVYKNSDWQNGKHDPVLMDAYVPEACGLTRIAGDLQRQNDWVFITPFEQTNGIFLQGLDVRNRDSIEEDKTVGWAQCFPGKSQNNHVVLGTFGGTTHVRDLGPAEGQVCYLLGFGGETTHNDDKAQAHIVNGRWEAALTGRSAALRAQFGCTSGTVTEVISAVEDENKYSSEFLSTGSGLHPDPVSCVLSEVYGRFRNTKSITVSLESCAANPAPTCKRYMLDVDQNTLDATHRIGGSMTCFTY